MSTGETLALVPLLADLKQSVIHDSEVTNNITCVFLSHSNLSRNLTVDEIFNIIPTLWHFLVKAMELIIPASYVHSF